MVSLWRREATCVRTRHNGGGSRASSGTHVGAKGARVRHGMGIDGFLQLFSLSSPKFFQLSVFLQLFFPKSSLNRFLEKK